MGSLTEFTIKYARFTWLLIFSVTLAGMTVYTSQPRQEDPEITIRNAQVISYFPGLAPERVELLVTRPIEEQIKTIPEVKEINSISMTGISIVTPEVDEKFSDMQPIWADLRNKMDDIKSQLPDGTVGPNVNDDYGRLSVITLALSGEDFTMSELHDAAKDIRDELNTLSLVARVDFFGIQEEKIWIEFDAAFMAQFGMDPAKLISAMRGQNIVLPGGTVEADGQNIVIEPSGDFQTIDDLRQLSIETDDGQLIYLEDLATIHRSYVDPPEAPAMYNGKPSIVIGISMVEKSNVVALGDQVTEKLNELKTALPLGMDMDIVIYQPDLVQASVSSASSNLMQTIAVVLAIVMLFLGWRAGLIVGTMVPLTIMATLLGMAIWAIELHRISIAAIIVALGLLVDNGVVIAESVRKEIDMGKKKLDAALSTASALAIPLLTSSLTTVAAFLPLMLMSGSSGEFLRSLGQVLTIALLSSWFIGITVVPAFCFWFMDDKKSDGGASDEINYDGKAYQLYKGFLGFILKIRVLFVLIMVGLLLSSMFIFGYIKKRSLGPSERNQFTVYVDLPSQATIDETQKAAKELSDFLGNPELNPEVTDSLAYVGSGGPRFFLALSPNDPQPNKAFMVVNTQTEKQIDQVMQRVERYFIEQMPSVNGRCDILFLGPAALGTVEIRVTGPEVPQLRYYGNEVTKVFHSVPGTQSVRNDWENAVFKTRIEVDQERARRAGITSEEIAQALSAYIDGTDVTSFREGDEVIPVTMRANANDRATLDRIRTVEVYSAQRGVPVPLIQIADFKGEVETSRIRRYNQKRALTVAGKNPDMTAVELYAAMKPKLDAIPLPYGYAFELEGEIKGSTENNEELVSYAPISVIIILCLLILQFNSFRRAAIILLTIPLVLIGANYGLWAFKGYFDFTAMLGLFSLAGIIINNGIVLIDRVDQQRQAGASVHDSVIEAALARARPIIMTTVTTVVGLIPLALFGGEFWYGMAIVIMSGLAVGTVLTLGFVPVLYSLFFGHADQKTN